MGQGELAVGGDVGRGQRRDDLVAVAARLHHGVEGQHHLVGRPRMGGVERGHPHPAPVGRTLVEALLAVRPFVGLTGKDRQRHPLVGEDLQRLDGVDLVVEVAALAGDAVDVFLAGIVPFQAEQIIGNTAVRRRRPAGALFAEIKPNFPSAAVLMTPSMNWMQPPGIRLTTEPCPTNATVCSPPNVRLRAPLHYSRAGPRATAVAASDGITQERSQAGRRIDKPAEYGLRAYTACSEWLLRP